MASLDITPAIINTLKSASLVTAQLGLGSNGIIVAGNLSLGRSDDATRFPIVAVEDRGLTGGISALPFGENIFQVRVYDFAPVANAYSYVRINAILPEIIKSLHRVTLTTEMSYTNLFELWYDNYISPELVDEYLKLPVRYVRFRAFVVSHLYAPQ